MNLEVIKNLSAFKRFGYPVLLGASRKSVIGLALDLPVEQREEGTLVTTAAAVFRDVPLCVCTMWREIKGL